MRRACRKSRQGAFEELLVNALVHRDYLVSAPIRLFIFDNRIEIISPGQFAQQLDRGENSHRQFQYSQPDSHFLRGEGVVALSRPRFRHQARPRRMAADRFLR